MPRIKLSEFKERKLADAVEIDYGDGVLVVPPPELWSDETREVPAGDIVALARAIVGADAYEAFVAAGGSASMLNAIIEEENGTTTGESSASPKS